MNLFRLTIGSMLLGALLIGCEARNKPGRLRAEADPFHSEGRVQFEDGWTRGHVKVVREPDAQRLNGGLLKITLTLRNTTKENLWIDIRCNFLDARGHVLEPGNWEPIMIDRSTPTEYTCTSMGSQAADYQIILKRAAEEKQGRRQR